MFTYLLPPQAGVNIVKALPIKLHPICDTQRRWYDTPLSSEITLWLDTFGVACLSDYASFHHIQGRDLPPLYDQRSAWRHCLKPASSVLDEVGHMLDVVQSLFGTRSFITVHARVEQHWQDECNLAFKAFSPEHRCYIEESVIASRLVDWFDIAPGSLLFVSTGSSLDKLSHLCNTFRCFREEALWSTIPPSRLEQAFAGYVLATYGTKFFGNSASTFSQELKCEFYNSQKPSSYINPGGPSECD